MKILITGGLGYIGSHCAELFLRNGFEVLIFDNVSRGFEGSYKALKEKFPKLKYVNGDLRDYEAINKVIKNTDFDGVLHFAALCSVNESTEKPELYFENNVMGTLNLLKCMKENNVKKLIFSSTAAVYGKIQELPVTENSPVEPESPYGESKLMAEKIIDWYGKLFGLNYVILRYFNVCGAHPEGLIGDAKKPSMHLMQNVVRGALGIEEFKLTCSKVDTPDGTPIRDYVDVNDLAMAHLLSYRKLDKKSNLTVNLGNTTGYSVKQIVNKVEEVMDVSIELTDGEKRKGEVPKIYTSNKLAKEELGWEPTYTLEDSVLNLKNWYTKHPNGFES